ncbi:SDR family oxidoreductase [Rhodovastum atsumiense]|uniref:SDR family oxidoreductase n=1 Tax=Rhodovastum atsumiense TaxID=504468 RepID=A0A5M6IUQ0_9PROT|nr:SDR family oxidoreductase [Rhodovastum atsumiense]KAA5611288.1 SDR family oxidoreductase [Rhodovastum atsumiense]CAH2601753.1 SDR family oxidoreductase [Rhodovastum atsumiense]
MPEDRTALVTGAARGIGAAVAARLAREGWRVVLVDRDPAGADLAARLGARFEQADMADEDEVIRTVASVRTQEGRLDALVSNAGFGITRSLSELTLTEWNTVLATNLTATFLLARAAEDLLRAARGAIVTIASTRAHMSEPDTFPYTASKGGLVALTHALAVSLGPEVRANCISPGWIHTHGGTLRPADHAQHPAGRVGTPEDIAALVAFLVGPESGFVTGAEFVVDGGMTRRMIYV